MRTLARLIGWLAFAAPQLALAGCVYLAVDFAGWRNVPAAIMFSIVELAPLWILWAIPTVFGVAILACVPKAQPYRARRRRLST